MFPEATNHLHDIGAGLTRPQVFEFEDGTERVVKMRRLCTAESLTADWIGSLLAVEFDILSPAPALVYVSPSAIDTMPRALRRDAEAGYAYANTYIPSATTVAGLQSLQTCENHVELLSRLVVLDSWLHTEDRMKPEFGRNLLIDNEDGVPKLLAIDFGMCLSDSLVTLLGPHDPLDVTMVCRREIRHLLDRAEAMTTLEMIEEMPEAQIVKFVNSTPDAWVNLETKGKIIRYLLDVRGRVRTAIVTDMGW